MNYAYSEQEAMYNQQFAGPLSISTLYRIPGHSHNVNGKLDGSKGFDWIRFMLKWSISGGTSYGQFLRQGERVGYRGQWLGSTDQITLSPWEWWDVSYNVSWGASRGKETHGDYSKLHHRLNQSLHFVFNLPQNIGITAVGEHYYHSTVQHNAHFYMADIGLTYTYKEWRFTLDWTNILNTQTYITASNNDLVTSYSEYELRPMMIRGSVRFKLW